MTPEQVRELLATIAGYDGRTVDARTIMDWHDIIKPIDFEVAARAVRVWYSENRGYIQPNDVVTVSVRLLGLDRAPSVTQRRIEGIPQPWDNEGLGAPWAPAQIERKNDEEA